MAKVLVYDAYANKFYKYNLSENDPMPYSYGNIHAPAGVPQASRAARRFGQR